MTDTNKKKEELVVKKKGDEKERERKKRERRELPFASVVYVTFHPHYTVRQKSIGKEVVKNFKNGAKAAFGFCFSNS